MRKEDITRFAGKVDHLELEHVIQIACLAGIIATILVRQGKSEGYIYVRHGQILHSLLDVATLNHQSFSLNDLRLIRQVHRAEVITPVMRCRPH
jgi:hypothetical protein